MKGIYKILNLVNGKFYIGMSNNIPRRFKEHRTPKNITGRNSNLAKAFRKYGVHNFSFEIIEICNTELELIAREIFYISKLKPQYNMNDGGNGNPGHHLSDEMKKHLSLKAKEQWNKMSDAQRKNIISNLKPPLKGHYFSEASKRKVGDKNRGRKQSIETRLKRSLAQKKSMLGNTNGNKPVIQMLNGKPVGKFESAVIAAKKLKIHPSNITSVARGRQKSAGGFQWAYKD